VSYRYDHNRCSPSTSIISDPVEKMSIIKSSEYLSLSIDERQLLLDVLNAEICKFEVKDGKVYCADGAGIFNIISSEPHPVFLSNQKSLKDIYNRIQQLIVNTIE